MTGNGGTGRPDVRTGKEPVAFAVVEFDPRAAFYQAFEAIQHHRVVWLVSRRPRPAPPFSATHYLPM